MPETIIESIVSGKISVETLKKWLNSESKEDTPEEISSLCCSRGEFVAYFLTYLRSQTESILQTNANALQIIQNQSTPEKLLGLKRSQPDNTSLQLPTSKDNKKPNRRVKTKLFNEEPSKTISLNKTNSDDSNITGDIQKLIISSTPMKNTFNNSDFPSLPVTSPLSPHKSYSKLNNSRPEGTSRVSDDASRISDADLQVNDGTSRISDGQSRFSNPLRICSTPPRVSDSAFINCQESSRISDSHSKTEHSQSRTEHTQSRTEFPQSRTEHTNLRTGKTHWKDHQERCDTPRFKHSRISSSEKTLSLGDYLVTVTSSKNYKKKKNLSKNSSTDESKLNDSSKDFDLSNSEMFPEIGSKTTSSKKGKKRIKPTNLNLSTNNFSSFTTTNNSFTEQSVVLEENAAFKQQKLEPKEMSQTFEAERNMLKQEKQKLVEKFITTKINTPQIKLIKTDSVEKQRKVIEADLNQVVFKEKLEVLADIYDFLLQNSFIISLSGEIYFLVSLVVSKQYEDDLQSIESELNSQETIEITNILLKSIHNASYFAVRTLWKQRNILEVMLDKNSLKLLGENKKLRAFSTELAKFLLNLYSLKCEDASKEEKSDNILELESCNGMICFNSETDNSDNFPSILSFQNFKKQRDMFYEILRWSEGDDLSSSRSTLRARIKSLLALSVAPSNLTHLARLLRLHMLAECAPPHNMHESKMSKLQRRLTSATASTDCGRLPSFTHREHFYREFLVCTESEAFRQHVRDSFATDLCALDAAAMPAADDKHATEKELSKEYLIAIRKLRLLSKFLGYLIALPYSGVENSKNTTSQGFVHNSKKTAPKEKVLQNEIAMRDYSQPPIDLIETLKNAEQRNRLTITLPWVVHYLSQLDYVTLRTKYYQKLLKLLFHIYNHKLKTNELDKCKEIMNKTSEIEKSERNANNTSELLNNTGELLNKTKELLNKTKEKLNKCKELNKTEETMSKSTKVYLKLCLSWLFELPHFPQDYFYDFDSIETIELKFLNHSLRETEEISIDLLPIINEHIIVELCPYVKDITSLVVSSAPARDARDGSFRHITPLTVTLPTDYHRDRSIQARLEQELVRSQPVSTRRVLDVVTDRVSSATVKELGASLLGRIRAHARAEGVAAVASWRERGADMVELRSTFQQIYARNLQQLHSLAGQQCNAAVASRSSAALDGLLASAPPPLHRVARRAACSKVNRWLHDNWGSTDILCKDIDAEIKNLIILGENVTVFPESRENTRNVGKMLVSSDFEKNNISPASVIIEMKECMSSQLAGERGGAARDEVSLLLSSARRCTTQQNILSNPLAIRAIMQLSVDLAVILLSKNPDNFTDNFLEEFNLLWTELCPNRPEHCPDISLLPERRDISPVPRNFGDCDELSKTPISSDDENVEKPTKIIILNTPDKLDSLLARMTNASGISSGKRNISTRKSEISPRKSEMSPRKSEMSPRKSELFSPKPITPPKPANLSPKYDLLSPISSGVTDKPHNLIVQSSTPKSLLQKPLENHVFSYDKITKFNVLGTSEISSGKLDYSTGKLDMSSGKNDMSSGKNDMSSGKYDMSLEKHDISTGTSEMVDLREFFESILCPRNIMLLSKGVNNGQVWSGVARLLTFLLRNNFLSEQSVTEQCVAVYKHEWPQRTLEGISLCMREVSSSLGRLGRCSRTITGFLEFLAQYCSDLDLDMDNMDMGY